MPGDSYFASISLAHFRGACPGAIADSRGKPLDVKDVVSPISRGYAIIFQPNGLASDKLGCISA